MISLFEIFSTQSQIPQSQKVVDLNLGNILTFTETELSSLFEAAKVSPNSATKWTTFKNGSMLSENALPELKDSSLKELSALPASLRISHIQMVSQKIKDACDYLGNFKGQKTTCNLYFTPNTLNNCFKFHSDFHESVVFQIRGNKKWFFLKNKQGEFIISPFAAGYSKKEESVEIDLLKNDVLYIGRSVVHKAEFSGSEASIHLTFNVDNRANHCDLAFDLLSESLNLMDINKLNATYPETEKDINKFIDQYLESIKDVRSELVRKINLKNSAREMLNQRK